MRVRRLNNWKEAQSLQLRWNELAAGVPFSRWEWLGTWWRHFSERGELYILVVEDDAKDIVAIAPWFVSGTTFSGRALHFLGSGKACSDYLGIMTESTSSDAAIHALTEWMIAAHQREGEDAWDVLCVDGATAGNSGLEKLLIALANRGCGLHRQPDESCWRIRIPESWESYLQQLPKRQRKHMRRAQAAMESPPSLQVIIPRDEATRDYVWDRFVELHQLRRKSLGQSGCFANPPFRSFLRETAEAFWNQGHLQLLLVEKSGVPIGSLLSFGGGGGVSYAYQMGTNPDFLSASPGWMVVGAAIKACIERKDTALDLLRGNECYKSRMGAVPHETQQIRIVSPRLGAKLRHRVWQTGSAVKNWLRSGILSTAAPSAMAPGCPI